MEPSINITANDDVFSWACGHGHLKIAKWILKINPSIDIFARTGEAFRWACVEGHLKVTKWLFKNKPSVLPLCKYAIHCACSGGHLNIAKWLLKVDPAIDISIDNECIFRLACENRQLKAAKWLLKIKPSFNISADNERVFRDACKYGYLEIAKWLFKIKPSIDLSIYNNYAFRCACESRRLEVARWLCTINPNYHVVVIDGKIEYTIDRPLIILNEVIHANVDMCPICHDRNADLMTNCKHAFCTQCVTEWSQQCNTCAMCRQIVTSYNRIIFCIKNE